ncbi:TetR/AcrR family transcriptional regulator [Pseudonocardia sp. EV170527-09]|uniref:TetR/AcrR family transcriptional regulator n=1 Tax=Pseudonocardia sp. EV170527-09 TaxID=2603411 RepID=UPI0011F24139|nr:TetR/AcrR family transcriptional regulator [Pseudonocardia sp. EV170527-09]KAA1031884.1 TetR/AcrR family transcriptional regulator [Pseudonocardia sp. EV170527-09]
MPAAITEEQARLDRDGLLEAAELLFYERGIRAVGMDQVRSASGLPLKRIYRDFATKEDLVVAVLRRRDERWRADLAAYVTRVEDPRQRLLAAFDWLGEWFARPGFRGCAWINAYGELGSTSEPVLREVRRHKELFHRELGGWASAAGVDPVEPVCLLAEGAMVTAAISGSPEPARQARAAVAALLP